MKRRKNPAEICSDCGKIRIKTVVAIAVAVLCLAAVLVGVFILRPEKAYREADDLLKEKKYAEARGKFQELGKFKNAEDMVKECSYASATDALEAGEYEAAKKEFVKLQDYKDSADEVKECDYQTAVELYKNDDKKKALEIFATLGDYEDSKKYIYDTASDLMGQQFLDACTRGISDITSAINVIKNEIMRLPYTGGSWSLDPSRDYYRNIDKDKQELKDLRAEYIALFPGKFIKDYGDEKLKKADEAFAEFYAYSLTVIDAYNLAYMVYDPSYRDSFGSVATEYKQKEQRYHDAVSILMIDGKDD